MHMVDEQEAARVLRLMTLLAERQSPGEVARQLNAAKEWTKRGKKWAARAVRDLARLDVYLGRRGYPRLVSDDLPTKEGSAIVDGGGTFTPLGNSLLPKHARGSVKGGRPVTAGFVSLLERAPNRCARRFRVTLRAWKRAPSESSRGCLPPRGTGGRAGLPPWKKNECFAPTHERTATASAVWRAAWRVSDEPTPVDLSQCVEGHGRTPLGNLVRSGG